MIWCPLSFCYMPLCVMWCVLNLLTFRLCVYLSLSCVHLHECVSVCGLCQMPCSWQSDHFSPWCFCPASKQQTITAVSLDCVCVDANVCPSLFTSLQLHKQRSCSSSVYFILVQVLNMQLSFYQRPGLQIQLLRPIKGPCRTCCLKAFRSWRSYEALGWGQKINSWPVSGLLIHKVLVIWEHPCMAYPYVLHSHDYTEGHITDDIRCVGLR